MFRMVDLQNSQNFDSLIKIFMELQLRSITQTECDKIGTCIYINFIKVLDYLSMKIKVISDMMICFIFVRFDFFRCRMTFLLLN